jgi:hypothetical protein
MNGLLVVTVLVIQTGLASYYAAKRGRDPWGWAVIGMLFGFLGLFLLFLLPPLAQKEQLPPPLAQSEMQVDSVPLLPPSEPPKVEWYYLDGEHQQQGPVLLEALRDQWIEKKISAESYVWCSEMTEWKKIGELPLKEALEKEQLSS